ncbi:hypothetical protein PENANT_c001G11687 [Penicillium antarcticum]|uniref:Uncharacterized protein n=1 Tax=Penicillium antarcticum TaxID=416450 RepID=A0A1V6QNR2_9EURO|nr:hypothetical protein PENANT_c001G11687 [Penicillium antarcticum]
MLDQYFSLSPGYPYPGPVLCEDPFWIAATCGSTDVLRWMLERFGDFSRTPGPAKQVFSLLNQACYYARIETVLFLLDSQPPFGTVHDREIYDTTALMSAACSFNFLGSIHPDTEEWIRDRIARGEKLMHILLDRGAPTQDASFPHRVSDIQPRQPQHTVLGLAMLRASSPLVKRLLSGGADVHNKQRYWYWTFCGKNECSPWDVTALHIGSLGWNSDGIQALLDDREITDLVLARDSDGRLPIHWAAIGLDARECARPDDDVALRLVNTFKVLLYGKPDTVNAPDSEGMTPLHHLVARHASCSGSKHIELATKFLLDAGADVSAQDNDNQTVLHKLCTLCMNGDDETTLLELLIAHGADPRHVDKNGQTALHLASRNLQQVQAVKVLLCHGADFNAVNIQGNTVFHQCIGGGDIPLVRSSVEKIRAQDEMIRVLHEAAGGEDTLMDQPNTQGRTPRQMMLDKRRVWQDKEERIRTPSGRRGRGRPRRGG